MTPILFHLDPVAKPRMTRRDRWKKRPIVERYYAYKDALKLQACGWVPPAGGVRVTFFLPMPPSWSTKKKERMNGQPHQQRPDIDNLHKAFLDALLMEDAEVWDHRITKLWSVEGKIEVDSEE